MRYNVRVVSPPDYWPSACFNDVADSLRSGFRELGVFDEKNPDKTIVLGWHLLPARHFNPKEIFYNLEQCGAKALSTKVQLALLGRHEVWDYSDVNIKWLNERKIEAKLVPIGYVPELEKNVWAEKDIDILFYGAMNERRKKILDRLSKISKVHVVTANVFGEERDRLIARSKIVLNVHFHSARIFEIVRCSYLFANKACVVSEDSENVPNELETEVTFAPYSQLVDKCMEVLQSKTTDWRAIQGYLAFKKMPVVNYLKNVVEAA